VHSVLLGEFKAFEKLVRSMARSDPRARLLLPTPAVGPIVGLTYASAIDDPGRFTSSKQGGPHFRLTPKKYQSGRIDVTGRLSKIGDTAVRTALYEAADKAGQGLLTAQDLGDAAGQTRRDEEGQGRARAQARGHPAPDARRHSAIQHSCHRS